MKWARHIWFWCLIVATATAVPIKPDLQKMLQQHSERPRQFEPARAGWNGPEMARPQDGFTNSVYDTYGPASTVRMVRTSLLAAAVPDPVAVAAVGVLILLLRYTRQRRLRRQRAEVVPIRPSVPLDRRRVA
jgi:hypothetical protein